MCSAAIGSEEQQGNAIRAEDLHPADALTLGFALYTSSITRPRLDGEDRAMLVQMSKQIVDHFMAFLNSFPPLSKEGLYVLRLLAAASSFAHGLARQQRQLEERRRVAEERRKASQQQKLIFFTRAGLMRGGFRLLLVGGFFFATVAFVMGSSSQYSDKPIYWLSLASAFGAMLLGTAWEMLQVERFQRGIFGAFHAEVASAKQAQSEGLRIELSTALEMANSAWSEYTGGRTPPEAKFIFSLQALISMYASRDREPPEPMNPFLALAGWLQSRKKPAHKAAV